MNWEDFWFQVLLVLGGAVGGALLLWAWLTWPMRPDDVDHLADAKARHPAGQKRDRDQT